MKFDLKSKIENFMPDIVATFYRFPATSFLVFVGTLITLYEINFLSSGSDEVIMRLAVGIYVGAIFALAGVLMEESQNTPAWLNSLVKFILPLLTIAAFQVQSNQHLVAFMLIPISILFLSVSPVLTFVSNKTDRDQQQDVFWWVNHRSVTTAVVAAVGILIVAIGLVAIERSMSLLFGNSLDKLIYEFMLPIAGFFLAPIYWISTIPKVAEFNQEELSKPDFLSTAIGFLGQFVLTPLLLIYGLILVAYAAQIVIKQEFPVGVLGWMVLSYTVIGAANILILHPSFMRGKKLVKLFSNVWFWASIIPLGLFSIAVFIRVQAYGFTEERVFLVVGGIWAIGLSIAYLTRRLADIRLIPGLALLLLLTISFGPWNFVQGALNSQANIVLTLFEQSKSMGWTEDTKTALRSALRFIDRHDEDGELMLRRLFSKAGVEMDVASADLDTMTTALGVVKVAVQKKEDLQVSKFAKSAYKIQDETALVGLIGIERNGAKSQLDGLYFSVEPRGIQFSSKTAREQRYVLDLTDFLSMQEHNSSPLVSNTVEFEFGNKNYRLHINAVGYVVDVNKERYQIEWIMAALFERP